ncbi:MAG: TIR domain-containing protein [Archaeoglobus sp.]|nr:TIR domain-containing protein [Archaeoglobus sp.]
MPPLRIYNLFISHSWSYSYEYNRLVNLLNNAPYFRWRNYSSPKHDPAIDPTTRVGREKLIKELANQIKPASCVLILSGLYVSYSYWIQREIDLALYYSKPIIGVVPLGGERMPSRVRGVADEIVGWRTQSIVDAIRRHSL